MNMHIQYTLVTSLIRTPTYIILSVFPTLFYIHYLPSPNKIRDKVYIAEYSILYVEISFIALQKV